MFFRHELHQLIKKEYSRLVLPLPMTSVRTFAASLLAITLSCSSLPAFAQTEEATSSPIQVTPQSDIPVRNDFQLGPTRFEMEMAPGEERTIEVQVISRMGKNSNFSFETEDFGPGETESEQTHLYGKEMGPYSAKTWLSPQVSSISLEHGDRVYIPVTIRVPTDSDPGDHYAALLAKREPTAEDTTAGGLSVISRVGVLFLVTVKGEVVKKGSLLSIATPKSLYFNLSVPLSLRGKNEGTIRLYPAGTIAIKNLLGVTVDEVPVQDWILLRNSTRSVQLSWSPRFALGRYTATTDVLLSGDATTPLSVSFWVIPLLPVLGILVAIFLVSFLVQYFFAKFEIRKK